MRNLIIGLCVGALLGGWIGYQAGRPSWLRAASNLASGQRAPGIVEAVGAAAGGFIDRVSEWRLQSAERQVQTLSADLTVAQIEVTELRARVGEMDQQMNTLRRAARDSAAQQINDLIEGVGNRAHIYAGECRDWALQPICPAVLRLRRLEQSDLSASGSALEGPAGTGGDSARVDRATAAAERMPRLDVGRAGAVRQPAGGDVDAGQSGSVEAAGAVQ